MSDAVPFELSLSDALKRRQFTVVGVWIDADATRVAYTVLDDAELEWPFPEMEGRDDADNEYLPRGGAMSPSSGGARKGTLTIDRPIQGARWLELRISWDEGLSDQTAEVRLLLEA